MGLFKTLWNFCLAGAGDTQESCEDAQKENVLPLPWKTQRDVSSNLKVTNNIFLNEKDLNGRIMKLIS